MRRREAISATSLGQVTCPSAGGGKIRCKIQDAHEAIRPTDITLTPVQVKEQLSRDQFRLYQLIWKRFTASRMRPAVYETTSVKVAAGEELFTLSASKIKFDGFMSVYSQDEDKETDGVLNESLEAGMKLDLNQLEPAQHFTQPPAHYTEASLVKRWKSRASDGQVPMHRPSRQSSRAAM